MGRLVALPMKEEFVFSSIYHFLVDYPEGLEVLRKIYKIPDEAIEGKQRDGGMGDNFDILDYINSDLESIQDVVEQSWEGTYEVYFDGTDEGYIVVRKIVDNILNLNINPHSKEDIKNWFENEIREITPETPTYMVDFWRNLVEALEE